VLVGGFGTRLRPLTLTTPKPILPVGHRPMIEGTVAQLAAHGVEEVVLSLGFRPDAFVDAFPDGRCAGLPLVYAVEPEPLDTAGAVRFAAEHGRVDDTFLVVNGDVVADVDIGALVAFHRLRGAEGTLHLTAVEDPSAFGVVATDEAGRVLAFVEKPRREEAPSNLISAGTYVLEPSVLDRIPSGRRVSIERETFPAMVAEGRLYAHHLPGYWLDTGTPAQYLRANLDLCGGLRRQEAPPALADGAVVEAGATVEGSVLEPGARVAAGAQVRDALLLAGAVVEPDAVVADSIVGPDAVVGRGASLLDGCVIGAGQRIAPGLELRGRRVPEPEG